jgi:hypothetical protein
MAEHTKGPWRPWEGGPGHLVVAENETTVAATSRDTIGPGHDTPSLQESIANARLIAVAPDMLAHIREAVENCETCRRDDAGRRCARCLTFMEDILRAEGKAR